MIKEHLTELSLKRFLEERCEHTFLHNKGIRVNDILFRADFRCVDTPIIIEFDGHHHYHVPERILRDNLMHKHCENEGIRLIRVPYFVQLNSEAIIRTLFDGLLHDYSPFNSYPHGFIKKSAMNYEEFSVAGLAKYRSQIASYPFDVREQIESSGKIRQDFLENKFTTNY